MRIFRALAASFFETLDYIWPLLVTHVALRLATAAVIVPLTGALVNFGIAFSDRPGLTDQDILTFFASPAGAVCFLAIASVLIVAVVLEVTAMTVVLHAGNRNALAALGSVARTLLPRLASLLRFAVRLTLRILLVLAPFVGIGLLVFSRYLSAFDINYYLSETPPEFWLAAAILGGLALILLGALLRKLMGWALSIHLILFRNRSPGAVFSESAGMMRGRRLSLLAKLSAWALVRVLAAILVAAVGAAVVAALAPVLGDNLRLAVLLVIVALGLVMVLDAIISSLANGMLAAILYHLYEDVTGAAPRSAPDQKTSIPLRAIIAVAATFIVGGIAGGGVILDQIRLPDTTLVIAHRGAAGARPENTLSSVDKAIEDRADWIEIDVQETAEGEVVVLHDSDFMKLAGNDLKIWNATREELDQIDIGSWFDPSYSDQRVPSLRDVLLTARGKAKVLIELKYYGHDDQLERRVSEIIDQTEMSRDIAVMSLKYAAVEKMHAQRPDLRVGVLAARAAGNLAKLDGAFLALNTGMISSRLLREAHRADKDVYVWTVNDPIAMSRFISMGVDGLITDEPALARQVLEERAELSVPERLLLWLSHRLGLTAGSERKMRDEAS